MFAEELRPFADVVLPATSYLERDGTMVNLEGRVQRLRRSVMPPCPDELAWIAKLAERFGVQIAPDALGVFSELSPKLFDGASLSEVGERGVLRAEASASAPPKAAAKEKVAGGGPLRLTSYRALFSGPAIERVPELRFQRPDHVVELSPKDASVRGVENGDLVRVSSNGTSVELRAHVNRRLLAGVVRAAAEHVQDLAAGVEVTKL
jgi:predicted molibdopterin-dependent oxidoreductase YjgC